MKFENIIWKTHPAAANIESLKRVAKDLYDDFVGSTMAKIQFDNGYGVSIVFGKMFYSNGVDTYECAVTHYGELCYDTWITNDVMGYLSKEELMQTIYEVERLCGPSQNYKFYICSIIQKLRRVWSYQVAPFLKRISVYQIQRLQTWFNSHRRSSK